jgi:hypothetical protein
LRKLVRAAAGEVVAWLDLDTEESEANGNLIAAAPELLEVLEALTAEAAHYIEPGPNGDFLRRLVLDGEAAVAKAKGEEG